MRQTPTMFCAHAVARFAAITGVRPFHSSLRTKKVPNGAENRVIENDDSYAGSFEKDFGIRTQRALWGHGRAVVGGDAACSLERWGQDQRACLPQRLPTGSDQIVMGSATA